MSSKPRIKLSKPITKKKFEIKLKTANKIDNKKKKDESNNKNNHTIVFIDASFFTFYRYHATKVWYSKHTQMGEEDSCTIENEEFLEKFSKHFTDLVNKIKKKFKTQYIYWFKDAPRSTIWRMPIADDYKEGRASTPGISDFFKYVFQNLIDPEHLISTDNAEADDLIAVACQYETELFQKDKNNKNSIIIVSGDTDLLQLVNDHTQLVKLPKLEPIPLTVKLDKNRKLEVSPRVYLEMKIILGDKTDNITKVFSGCGPKTSYDIANDPTLFKKHIEDHPKRLAKYEHNKTMIDFERIPSELRETILQTYLKQRYH